MAVAKEKTKAAGITNIEYQQGNILDDESGLPYDDSSMDAVRSARVFQHLNNPFKALKECIRVIKPGGRIVLSDPDWDTLTLNTKEMEIWQRIKTHNTQQGITNGHTGTQHFSLFEQVGLLERQIYGDFIIITDYEITKKLGDLERMFKLALENNIVTQQELDCLRQDLEQHHQNKTFCITIVVFTVSGVKP